jgi:hypothetical protein
VSSFGNFTLSFGKTTLLDNFFILTSSSGKNTFVSGKNVLVSIPFILVSFALIKGLVTFDSGDTSKSLSFNSGSALYGFLTFAFYFAFSFNNFYFFDQLYHLQQRTMNIARIKVVRAA